MKNYNMLVPSHTIWATRMKIVVLALLFEAVSKVILAKIRRQNTALFCFGFFHYCAHHKISHNCLGSSGEVSWRAEPSLPNSAVSEWNGASHLFRQNTAITHSIRRSVLALTVTNHIQRSQWGGLVIWQQRRSLWRSFKPIQHLLTTILKRGAEWSYILINCQRCHWSKKRSHWYFVAETLLSYLHMK